MLNDDIERDMVEYAKKAAVILHGITVDDQRQLAFRLAVTKKAGVDWAKHFLIWSLHGQICLIFQLD